MDNDYLPDEKIRCPYTWFEKTCREIVSDCTCPKYQFMPFEDPTTDPPRQINKWGCVDGYLHLILVDAVRQQHQTGAAIESFRNEMVQGNREAAAVLRAVAAPAGPGAVAIHGPTSAKKIASPGQE